MEGQYILYAHVNKDNGKRYIGITCQVPEIRWGTNGRNYHDSPKFWNAIQKYGWDSFDHLVLAEGLTQEEARKLEIDYIKRYDAINNGYNISPGGDVPPIFRGEDHPKYHKHPSEETRAKMKTNHADFSDGNHPLARSVICIETGVVYDTIGLAAAAYNVNRNCISACCHGNLKTSGGLHWKFA